MSLVIILAATQGLLVGSGMCTQGCRTLSPTMMAVNPAIAVREAAKKAAQLNEQDAPAFSQSVPLEPATASSLAEMHEPSVLAARSDKLNAHSSTLDASLLELKAQQDELGKLIAIEEAEKKAAQDEIRALTAHIRRINESLAPKLASHAAYERTINDAERDYNRIKRNSQTLLTVLGDKSVSLSVQKQAVMHQTETPLTQPTAQAVGSI